MAHPLCAHHALQMNNEIPFTQFMLPHGRRNEISIERPEPIAEKARALLELGLSFQIEMLTTGQIHMTVSDTVNEEDLYAKVVRNGPDVPVAVDKMITEAYQGLIEHPRRVCRACGEPMDPTTPPDRHHCDKCATV